MGDLKKSENGIKDSVFAVARNSLKVGVILAIVFSNLFTLKVYAMESTPISNVTEHEQNTNSGLISLSNNGHATLILHQIGGDYANDFYAAMEGNVLVYDSSNQLIKTIKLFEADANNFVGSASIAKLKNGGFVVVWTTSNSAWDTHLNYPYYQLYDNVGNAIGISQKISTANAYPNTESIHVIGRSDGGFTVVFTRASDSVDILATYTYNGGTYSKVREVAISNSTDHNTDTPTENDANLFMSMAHPKVIELSDGSMIVGDFTYVHVLSGYTPLGDFVYKFDSSGAPVNFADGYPMKRINWMGAGDAYKAFDLVALSDGGFATINSNQYDSTHARWEIAIFENDGTPRFTDTLTQQVYNSGNYSGKNYYGKAITDNPSNNQIWDSMVKINAMEIDGEISVILADSNKKLTLWTLSKDDGSVIASEDLGFTLRNSDGLLINPHRIQLPNGEWAYTYEEYFLDSEGDYYITSSVYSANIDYFDSITFNFESGVTGMGTSTVKEELLGETLKAVATSNNLQDGQTAVSMGIDNYSLYASLGETAVTFSLEDGKKFDLDAMWFKDGGNVSGQGETIRIVSSKGTVEKTYIYNDNNPDSGTYSFNAASDDVNQYLKGITSFTVSVADGSIEGLTFDEITLSHFTIPTGPTFTSGVSASFAENKSGMVYTSQASGSGSMAYSITGGADQNKFMINSLTGELSFKSSPDFEQPADVDKNNVYEITISATDENGVTSQNLVVTVTDISDVNFSDSDNTSIEADSLTKSVTAGSTADITFKASPSGSGFLNIYAPGENETFPGGVYAWSGIESSSLVTLYIKAQEGYSFDLSSFKYAADHLDQNVNAIQVGFTSGGIEYNNTYAITQDGSIGYGIINTFDHAINDVTQVILSASDYIEFQDIEITDIKSSQTAPGVPTNVITTRGNGRVIVKFTAPASDGGSPITGYKIKVYEGETEIKTVDAVKSPATVTGLANGTTYTFKVSAVNAVGEGPDSEASNSVTPATIPGAPTNLAASGGNGQAVITFDPPVSDGGAEVTQYIIVAEPGGKTVAGTGSPITITGLTNGKTYKFTVKAKNAAGTSVPTYSSSVTVGSD